MIMRNRRTALAVSAAAAALLGGAVLPTGPASAGPAPALASSAPSHPGLNAILASGVTPKRAIAVFSAIPTATQVAALKTLGLEVSPLKTMRLALVAGPVSLLQSAVEKGLANDIYADHKNVLFDTTSVDSLSSTAAAGDQLRATGYTGKGVTVAVMDGGCDATHPDLKKRITHNVQMVSPEPATNDPMGLIVPVPVDQGPASNTDTALGHGTVGASIIAADGTTGSAHDGVAPEANLVCINVTDASFTGLIVTGYDYLLSQPGHWGVKVINNSWGNGFRRFDPNDPINIATKAAADQGIALTFASGNWGDGNAPQTMNPYAQAPWVMAVGGDDNTRHRWSGSASGIRYDASSAVPLPADGHSSFTGDSLGLSQVDIVAPSVGVGGACAAAALAFNCTSANGGWSNNNDGTSFAAPHIAGALAVLFGANPQLTPEQAYEALEATASRSIMDAGNDPFWQVGYGAPQLDKAVSLVTGANWASDIASAFASAQQSALASDGQKVVQDDFWEYDAPPATYAGTDTRDYTINVGTGTERLGVSLSFPSAGYLAQEVLTSYTVSVVDPSGKTVATFSPGSGYAFGVSDGVVPVTSAGTYTFHVVGNLAASDPDTVDSDSQLGRKVTLTVAQLQAG